jgi:hypothetical protein
MDDGSGGSLGVKVAFEVTEHFTNSLKERLFILLY